MIYLVEEMCLKIIELFVKLSENKCLLKCVNLKYILYISFSFLFFFLSIERQEYFLLRVALCITIFLFPLMSACGLRGLEWWYSQCISHLGMWQANFPSRFAICILVLPYQDHVTCPDFQQSHGYIVKWTSLSAYRQFLYEPSTIKWRNGIIL